MPRNNTTYDNKSVGMIKKRKCHDCGKPTFDYRCSECLRKWREKHHVVLSTNQAAESPFCI